MDIDVSKLPTTSNYKVNRLFVTVYQLGNLQEKSFQGFAESVSSYDIKGPFDILGTHENFITQFVKGVEIVTEKAEKIRFEKASGVLEVANNVVKIFLKQHENPAQ